MTFNELLMDAIKFDEPRMAYAIFWLIKHDVYKGTDRADNVNWDLVDQREVEEMTKRNELNLQTIKLYTMPLGNGAHFIAFALDEKSAKSHCLVETHKLPTKVIDISHKMDMDFWFEETNEYKSLRKLKDEQLSFPATAMIYKKDGG